MSKIKCAVIGLGMGTSHIHGYQGHPDAEIVAIADLNEDLLKSKGDEYSIPGRYTSVEEMFEKEDIDVVSIATPNSLHKPFTLMAIANGCHVLCEKPMAMNTAEAEEMLAAADKAGTRIMINFSYRFNDASWGIKDQVKDGALGEVYTGRTRWTRRDGFPGFGGWFGTKKLSGGGPLIDLGVHRIDLALWLIDYPEPEWVLGRTHKKIGVPRAEAEGKTFDVEDFASAIITFTNGMSLQVEASWGGHTQYSEDMETTLVGTKAGLTQRNIQGRYDFEAFMFTENAGCKMDVEMKGGSAPKSAQWHYVDSILNKKPHIATGAEGVTIMKILDAIYESAETGAPVHLQPKKVAIAST
ncbi:MAG: Gfo/Idh/MocA family oxidoreductase [Planctomycetes bacterium]|nr:Gfo/Idh/MocA family oxidoreductase [Planctomycetota bacterium]